MELILLYEKQPKMPDRIILTRGTIFETRFTVEQALEEVEAIFQTVTVLDEPNDAANRLRELVRRYKI